MSFVTIPFVTKPGCYRCGLGPICIAQTDAGGRRIASGWFEAVVTIAEYLRKHACRRVGRVWRVSELAELSVHAQRRNHGEGFGTYPNEPRASIST